MSIDHTSRNAPKLGPCSCRRGVQRDNCPECEGTGQRLDFAAIRATSLKEAYPTVAKAIAILNQRQEAR